MATLLNDQTRQRKFQARLNEQNERHARGEIDPELARRLTKPKVADTMYQVYADIRGGDGSHPISPMFAGAAGQEACGQILEAVNSQICLGKLKGWGNTRIEPVVHIPANH